MHSTQRTVFHFTHKYTRTELFVKMWSHVAPSTKTVQNSQYASSAKCYSDERSLAILQSKPPRFESCPTDFRSYGVWSKTRIIAVGFCVVGVLL